MNFGGVIEGRDNQMYTFGLSSCCVKHRWLQGRRGSHTTARELQTCTFQGPGASTPPKFQARISRERKKKKLWREEGKKAKFWAPHPSGLHPSGLHPSGPLRGPTLCRPKIQHPKIGRNRIGRSRNWPKSKKKAGRSRSRLPDQHGVHDRNISCGHDLTRHRGMVSTFCSARTSAQYGFRGVRVGEASNLTPGSKRSRALWLWALQRSMDSDGESSEDPTQLDRFLSEGDQQFVVRPPLPDVVDALEQDLVDDHNNFPGGVEVRHVVWRPGSQNNHQGELNWTVMMNNWPQQWLQAVVRTVQGWQRLTSQLTIRTVTQCLILLLFWRRAKMPRMCTIS